MTDTDTKPVVKYSPSDAVIADLRSQYAGLTCDTKEGYELTRQAIGTIRTYRVEIEKHRVFLKADALEYGRKVDSEAKRLTADLLAIEEPLKAKKKAIDDEKERVIREAEEAERARAEAVVKARLDAEEAARRQVREAEEARLREVAAGLEAERQKLAAERAQAVEAQRVAQEKIEDERREFRRQQQLLAEEQDRIARAHEAERQRLEREEFERQAKVQAVQEANERVARERLEAEARKAEAERLAEAERKRIEAERPDVEKVQAFAAFLRTGIIRPVVKSKRALALIDAVMQDLATSAAMCENFK